MVLINMLRENIKILFWILFISFGWNSLNAQATEIKMLSGSGKDNPVQWQFLCTSGKNAGKWTLIPVPSCWELQGFGKYDYGFAKDSVRGKEQGMYKYSFQVSNSWKEKKINLVFEGVMTDAEVRINGTVAGPIHQGAFYTFKYEISKLLQFGKENVLEVTVSKHSSNKSVNEAERKGDFWLFGGIFRPVFLEALPASHIESVAVNAMANGHFTANVQLEKLKVQNEVASQLQNSNVNQQNLRGTNEQIKLQLFNKSGKPFGPLVTKNLTNRDGSIVIENDFITPKLWSAETPILYKAVFGLYKNGKLTHQVEKKIGFRTVQVKQRDGIYVNGVKMKFKGVNRHSFWPNSGRTTSKELSIEDVRLMKDMNMNAVRMSHYPPDAHFLDVCDSMGLYVMDELAGWHGNYDTPTGSKLLKEMIDNDRNHPSIVIWSNGNEGGHNLALDHLFTEFDLQKRPVVHPWQLFGGIETQHYREYNYGIGNYDYGHDILLPTEFLHGWFDGGHGAGLDDYWNAMLANPLSAGGFLWDFADEAVVRTDQNGKLDTDAFRGADGIVGPYHEKEGSYFAIKEIWSPVHIERREISKDFNGEFNIENRYNFTNINQCSFSWELKRFNGANRKVSEKLISANEPIKSVNGKIIAPNIEPFDIGKLVLKLPMNWQAFDVLFVKATDPNGKELFTWSYTITKPEMFAAQMIQTDGESAAQIKEQDSVYQIHIKDLSIVIHKISGLLLEVKQKDTFIPFNHGPVLQEGENNFQNFHYRFEGKNLVIESSFDRKKSYNTLQWTIYPSGWIKMKTNYFPSAYFTVFDGVNFSYPEQMVKGVEYLGTGPYRVWKNRMKGGSLGVWNKTYNSTETGESWNYPEFKGYYANLYWCKLLTTGKNITVVTEDEDVFMRLFTPAFKTDQWKNYEPLFPTGDISFMQGIASIGSKTQRNETTGPMGMKNIFYDYEKDPARAKQLVLYFNFMGN